LNLRSLFPRGNPEVLTRPRHDATSAQASAANRGPGSEDDSRDAASGRALRDGLGRCDLLSRIAKGTRGCLRSWLNCASPKALCTDNAAMIAALAKRRFLRTTQTPDGNVEVKPGGRWKTYTDWLLTVMTRLSD
jgi:hypothetical protein